MLKWLESKIIVICLKLREKLFFSSYFIFFSTFLDKVVQTFIVLHETWHQTLFSLYYCVDMVILENNSHVLENTCYVVFLMFFFYFFGTFSHKVVQTCFVSHETWRTTLFGINYFVQMVQIENYSHMLEIRC